MIGPQKRQGHTHIDAEIWWSTKSIDYPFHAKAPTSVKPQYVPGDHASVGIGYRTGWRIYGFKTEADRDMFCTQFGGIKV